MTSGLGVASVATLSFIYWSEGGQFVSPCARRHSLEAVTAGDASRAVLRTPRSHRVRLTSPPSFLLFGEFIGILVSAWTKKIQGTRKPWSLHSTAVCVLLAIESILQLKSPWLARILEAAQFQKVSYNS